MGQRALGQLSIPRGVFFKVAGDTHVGHYAAPIGVPSGFVANPVNEFDKSGRFRSAGEHDLDSATDYFFETG